MNTSQAKIKHPSRVPIIGIGGCPINYSAIVPAVVGFGQTVHIPSFRRDIGGPVATAMIALSRLGINTAFAGIVGGDDEGRLFRDILNRHNIDISTLAEDADAKSRIVIALVDRKTGDRGFYYRPDTCRPLQLTRDIESLITSASILLLEDAEPVSLAAARYARETGKRVVFDAGWLSPGFNEILPLVDHMIASKEFIKEWKSNIDPVDAIRHLRQSNTTCIITLGGDGSLLLDDDGLRHVPAFPVTPVDTTGAGDAFHGGYIYGLLQGWNTLDRIKFASAVAALNCRELGATAGLPSLPEVIRFLDDMDLVLCR